MIWLGQAEMLSGFGEAGLVDNGKAGPSKFLASKRWLSLLFYVKLLPVRSENDEGPIHAHETHTSIRRSFGKLDAL